MFFRPETSLLPSVIALSRFFIDNFPHISWYPYWYLGNPFSYLIGPVVPFLLLVLTRIFPSAGSGQVTFSLYYLYLGLIVLSVLGGGIGIYLFVKDWLGHTKASKRIAGISAFFYIFLPFSWWGLYYQNGLKHVAFVVVPFVFLVYRKILIQSVLAQDQRSQSFRYFLLALLITVCLLVTVNILLLLIVGAVTLFIVVDKWNNLSLQDKKMSDEGRKRMWAWREEMIVRTAGVFLLAIFLATFWYTPKFWLVLLTNPSFGGVPLWNLIVNLFQSILNFLPLVLAILVVKWRSLISLKALKDERSQCLFFAFLFFLSFFFLTIVRLLADPKFVIDWIGFMLELQFGASILGGVFVVRLLGYSEESQNRKSKFKSYLKAGLFLGLVVILLTINGRLIFNLFFYSKSDYQQHIIAILQSHIKDEDTRVFLSGSDVFWINSYLPIQQIRGGNDGVSIYPYWASGAYQVREGEKGVITEEWLRIFGSSYVLIHQSDSFDPFHDFKHPEKFGSLQLLADQDGDKLYKVPNVSIARVVDRRLLTIGKPKNGADEEMLRLYTETFKRLAVFRYESRDVVSVKSIVAPGEVVNLALSYDPAWRLTSGNGKIVGDTLGNTVIVPNNSGMQEFVLQYERGSEDWIITLILTILGGGFLWKFLAIYPRLKRLMPKMHMGIGEEEEY
jgi:hypothetical protein